MRIEIMERPGDVKNFLPALIARPSRGCVKRCVRAAGLRWVRPHAFSAIAAHASGGRRHIEREPGGEVRALMRAAGLSLSLQANDGHGISSKRLA